MVNTALTIYAPGRINIIGEHTDYNDGFVLPAAIDKGVKMEFEKVEGTTVCHINSLNFNTSFDFDLLSFSPSTELWQNYFMGIVNELLKRKLKLSGFRCKFFGNVPIGSGMSSSAAMECSFIFGLNEIFNLGLNRMEMVEICNLSNNYFIGIKSGIMDQFASLMGKQGQVIKLDCRSLEYEYFPLELEQYQLLLLNTNVSHSLASSEYNTRQEECQEGLSILKKRFSGVESFRDVTQDMLLQAEENLPPVIFKRCRHVLLENNRVFAATKSMLKKDFKALGELLYASHFSLQNDYKVSCPELDFLVEQTIERADVLGSRMMGGGFGGCTINLVKKSATGKLVEDLSEIYLKKFNKNLTPYEVEIGDGASVQERSKVKLI